MIQSIRKKINCVCLIFLYIIIFFLRTKQRREIAALTKENYSLERQIFAYQRSISMANNQINVQNNMSRLSISSPSKPNPPCNSNLIGYGNNSGSGSGAGGSGTGTNTPSSSSYRLTQLETNPGYYNHIVDDMNSAAIAAAAAISGGSNSGSRTIPRPEAINYSTERSATPVPSSPMQPSSIGNIAQPSYLGSNLEQGIPLPTTTRHSFSGPTTPHHHHHQQQQQYQGQQGYSTHHQQQLYHHHLQQQQQQHLHHHHHHQLPQIPSANVGIPYSSSNYRLRSPSSNPNIAQMYHDDDGGRSDTTTTTNTTTSTTMDGSIDDAYQSYAGRYKLTV